MNLEEKLSLIAEALDIEPGTLKPETRLEDLQEWDSLGMVSLIAMLDKHFSVRLQPEEIRALVTVEDILSRMKEGSAGGK
ncbi:MAG: acyl carrier protein [Synergistaceae bacterium]|uniref:acyl carrier protein n=1 Tax=Acetomicrobium sp. S15 = DSM 107314 TaxID=2529858 RepID=UPI0018E147ED|nr:acyl carrier protein [Acetomicrobium sp. S15 = DSM 107314]MDI3532483.1 acyl carrier protein [Synergistaceae bacterium]